mgnify:CR=1 FL=1
MILELTEIEKDELIKALCARCDLDLEPEIKRAMKKEDLNRIFHLKTLYDINQNILFRLQGIENR